MPGRTTVGSAPKRDLRRIVGTLTLQLVLLAVIGLLLTLATFHQEDKPGFTPVPRKPYTPAYNPITLAELGVAPDTAGTDRAQLAALPKDDRIRLIAVRPEGVSLIRGGVVVRTIATGAVPSDLDQLTTLINDGSWIDRRGLGDFVINSALVAYRGMRFTFGGPLVRTISLPDRFSVFLGASGASIAFDNVRVKVVDIQSGQPHSYRPFVIATKGSTMNIRGSDFSGLGWDWNGSYGVSWLQDSTGEAVDSSFADGYIGVYTARAVGVALHNCALRGNYMYGLEQRTFSRDLVDDNVVAEGNGAHGIFLSDNVTQSVIRNSTSRNNGENGIVIDKDSTGNRVESNTVADNRGDGLVISDSPDNAFVNNTVESNRVGVRVSPPDPAGTGFRANQILGNGSAAENIAFSEDNVVRDNGGNWNHRAIGRIWPTVLIVLGLIGLAHTAQTVRRLRRVAKLQ